MRLDWTLCIQFHWWPSSNFSNNMCLGDIKDTPQKLTSLWVLPLLSTSLCCSQRLFPHSNTTFHASSSSIHLHFHCHHDPLRWLQQAQYPAVASTLGIMLHLHLPLWPILQFWQLLPHSAPFWAYMLVVRLIDLASISLFSRVHPLVGSLIILYLKGVLVSIYHLLQHWSSRLACSQGPHLSHHFLFMHLYQPVDHHSVDSHFWIPCFNHPSRNETVQGDQPHWDSNI